MPNNLPEGGDKFAWPPKEYSRLFEVLEEASLWYGGSAYDLMTYYDTRANYGPGVRFWANIAHGTRSAAVHVPIGADLASASAFMLFGEAPDIRIPDASPVLKGGVVTQSTIAKTTEDRLLDILKYAGVSARILEAAEVCSGLGGVFLKVDFDKDLADHPLLTVVHPDNAIPTMRWGRLVSVVFWRVVEESDKYTLRHLEGHTRDGVYHGLYRGTKEYLGNPIDLTAHPETEGLLDYIESDDLNVVYIPNSLPHRRYRNLPFGQSDFADCYTLMESLDEAYSNWVRDIRLGASRVFVPEEYLTVETNAATYSRVQFDLDREIFSPLSVETSMEGAKMTTFQPAIRHEEHYRTCMEFISRILSVAGYSMQTFGLGSDSVSSSTSAAALKVRERKTLMTKARKERYWGPALEYILYRVLVVDAQEFGTGILPSRPTVGFGDSYAPDLYELAQVVELLERARAATTKTKVELLHQEWDAAQVQEEVDALDKGLAEQVAAMSFNRETAGMPNEEAMNAPENDE